MSNKPTLITSDVARDNNNKIIDLYECTCYKKYLQYLLMVGDTNVRINIPTWIEEEIR